MLFNGAAAAAPNAESVWDIIIAISAIVGILLSFVISIITLRQTKKIAKRQTDVTLFNERYELIDYLTVALGTPQFIREVPGPKFSFELRCLKAFRLFKNHKDLEEMVTTLFTHQLKGTPLPDYREKYKDVIKRVVGYIGSHPEYTDIEHAFAAHAVHCVKQLRAELGIIND